MELADAEVRQADLERIDYFRGEGRDIKSGNERHRLKSELLWPIIFDAQEAFDLVWHLHQWAKEIGTEKAINLVVEIVREESTQDIDGLFVEFENRSGTPIGE